MGTGWPWLLLGTPCRAQQSRVLRGERRHRHVPPSTLRMRKTSGRVVLLLYYYYMIIYIIYNIYCYILYILLLYTYTLYNNIIYYTSYIIGIIIPILEMQELGLSQSLVPKPMFSTPTKSHPTVFSWLWALEPGPRGHPGHAHQAK